MSLIDNTNTLRTILDEVNALPDASGGTVSGGVLSGSFTPTENMLEVTVDVGKPFTNFVCQANGDVLNHGAKATKLLYIDGVEKISSCLNTNNAGSSLSGIDITYDANNNVYYPGIYNSGQSTITLLENKIIIVCGTSGTVIGAFVGGITYSWYAW